jgi:type IV pilus assembly protein PilA
MKPPSSKDQRPRTGDRLLSSVSRPAKRAGFTLIELLVVVAIIGILTGVAMPQLLQYRRRAIDAAVKSDLRNAQLAVEAYHAYRGEYPETLESAGFRGSETVATELKAGGGVTIVVSKAKTSCSEGTGVWVWTASEPGVNGIPCG